MATAVYADLSVGWLTVAGGTTSVGATGTTGAGGVAAAAAALDASRFARCSSRRISSSSVLFSSLDAFLNSDRLFPSERPNSGSFLGPKMMRAITKMMISSGMPMEPNIAILLSKKRRVETPSNHYRNRSRAGQGNPRREHPEVVAGEEVI